MLRTYLKARAMSARSWKAWEETEAMGMNDRNDAKLSEIGLSVLIVPIASVVKRRTKMHVKSNGPCLNTQH